VLLDSERGWLAIDPKGIVGELAYELGAALRNPVEQPELFAQPSTINKRVDAFAKALSLDAGRILGWAFAQAVLAAVWELEDDGVLSAGIGWIALANAIRPMLNNIDT
jgi:streptomycin 6-kinase